MAMVKIEVKLVAQTTIYRGTIGGSEEVEKAWLFESKASDGKWVKGMDKGEWGIQIEQKHPCLKNFSNLEQEIAASFKKNVYQLEFEETDDETKGRSEKRRIFWKEHDIRANKKSSKDNPERERERERERDDFELFQATQH